MPPARKKAAKKAAKQPEETPTDQTDPIKEEPLSLEEEQADDPPKDGDTANEDETPSEPTQKSDDEDGSEDQAEGAKPYDPAHPRLQNAGFDHKLAEEKRQAELDEERKVHNERTGDASLAMGRHRTGGTSDWVSQDRPN